MFTPKQPISPRARSERAPSPLSPGEQTSPQGGKMIKSKLGDSTEKGRTSPVPMGGRSTVDPIRASPNFTSMQTELLEKIKKDLEDEGCNLIEQRRREVIDEVERQIEEERKRVQSLQEIKFQQDLAREFKLHEQELERKRAWEEKMKKDAEENEKMNRDITETRQKREDDLAKVLELETKSFELESLQRLKSFRASLDEEEVRMIEAERAKASSAVEERMLEAEDLIVEEMKDEALARMKRLGHGFEKIVYERELEVARKMVVYHAEAERQELRRKIEKEVDAEIDRFKEEIVKERRERMLQQICRRIAEDKSCATRLCREEASASASKPKQPWLRGPDQ